MFVQLRRVVYLLVLLHCCTSVAYAQSVEESAKDVVLRKEKRLRYIESHINATRNSTFINLFKLRDERKLFSNNTELAKSAAEEADNMCQQIETVIKKKRTGTLNESDLAGNLTAGLLKNATDAVQKVKDAVGKLRRSASTLRELGNSCYEAYDNLSSLIWAHKPALRDYVFAIDDAKEQKVNMTKQWMVAEKSHRKQEKAETLKERAIHAGKQCFQFEREANSQAVSAENKMRKLESLINQFKALFQISSPTTANVPTDDSKGVRGNQTPEKVTKEPVVINAPEATKEPEMTESPEVTEEPKEPEKPEGTKKPEGPEVTTEEPKTTEEPRKARNVRETVTTPSGTVHSKDVLRTIAARLSDSSSSPALVHSPLLLLLVSMCVLGCTAVF
ncbi:uncharacterized protein TM35_000123300 [Trypanosoma theileri]|uniref:Uncharacterized protein n=1 Tax=Trypanosoma theileri TaxID=67003 RepID=A0A1X0NY09_9TRYP|nr:uncharacterized protein TM35_000123300 [Trypanosoma theileri]ORC89555.1 hypothetical protein TM35_000123300 [Trypanosoma theileri]